MNESRLKSRCECGHPKATHRPENSPVFNGLTLGPCHATLYTDVPMGTTATRCKCRGFKREALGG